MEKRAFATPQGELWVWGVPCAFEGERPLVFAIAGMFAQFRAPITRLAAHISADFLFTHQPGTWTPMLTQIGVEAAADAVNAALEQIARPVLVVAESVGAVEAMRLHSKWVRGLVLFEPLLRTDHPKLSALMESNKVTAPRSRPLIEAMFCGRTYFDLPSRITVPTWVVAGNPAHEGSLPGLLTAADLDLYRCNPRIRVIEVAAAGHDVLYAGSRLTVELVTRAIAEVLGPQ